MYIYVYVGTHMIPATAGMWAACIYNEYPVPTVAHGSVWVWVGVSVKYVYYMVAHNRGQTTNDRNAEQKLLFHTMPKYRLKLCMDYGICINNNRIYSDFFAVACSVVFTLSALSSKYNYNFIVA